MREKKKVKKKKKIDNYIFKRVRAPWLQVKTMKRGTEDRNDANNVKKKKKIDNYSFKRVLAP